MLRYCYPLSINLIFKIFIYQSILLFRTIFIRSTRSIIRSNIINRRHNSQRLFITIYNEYRRISFPPGRKSYHRKHVYFVTRYPEQIEPIHPPNYPFIHPRHYRQHPKHYRTIIHDLDPPFIPLIQHEISLVNGGGGGGSANSRLLSSTGEQRVDQRIAKHEPYGGQPRVLDSSRPYSSIGTAPFPRRDINSHLSVHVAEDQGRQGAREGGNRDTGREQSTTGPGTAQIRFNDRCPTRVDLDLLFVSDLTIVQSRYLATFVFCLTGNESQTKASRWDHFATCRIHARMKGGLGEKG